jgi:dienelactone hydrolase
MPSTHAGSPPSRRTFARAGSTVFALPCLLLPLALAAADARARVVEERIAVPVEVTDAHGGRVTQDIVVEVFHDDAAPKPYPVLVLNHGRAVDAAGRSAVGVAAFRDTSRWLAGFGFIVAVPTRVGYGVTGGPDVEDSGACERKVYPPAYRAAADETLQVLANLRRRPDVARDRAIVMGQSFGGATAVTVASMNVAGVTAGINFAGGGGGNPQTHPQSPCLPAKLQQMFAGYGRTSRIPTLWVYSANDMYFGPSLPRQWFDAFRAEGGTGEFEQFPAFGTNGHFLFSRGSSLWQPRVQSFLERLGYARLPHSRG